MADQDQVKYANKLHSANVLALGGTSGIGFAVAEAALEFGSFVTVASSNPQNAQDTVAKLQTAYPSKKANVKGYVCDLGVPDRLEENIVALLDTVVKETGRKIDHIVHTAGVGVWSLKLVDL